MLSHCNPTTMLQRSSRRLLPALSRRTNTIRTYAESSHGAQSVATANDPNPKPAHSPVAPTTTNAMATSAQGGFDKVLQESAEEGEEKRVMQAPNRTGIWTRSQKPRAEAMVGPRFEQTIMEDQVCRALYIWS